MNRGDGEKQLVWLILLAAALIFLYGCTVIVANKSSVHVIDKDDHSADGGTNSRSWDLNVSPR